jgi:hypothetical protein
MPDRHTRKLLPTQHLGTATLSSEPLSKEETDLLVILGTGLVMTQLAERAIRLCLTFVIQKPNTTAELLLAQIEQERRRTLGLNLPRTGGHL